MKLNRSFSLIELLVILALITIFLCLSSSVKTDITFDTAPTKLNNMVHTAQKLALQKGETVYLANNGNKICIYDQYGKILKKNDLKSDVQFWDSNYNQCFKIAIFASGFTSIYSVKFQGGKCFNIDPISLNMYEIKR